MYYGLIYDAENYCSYYITLNLERYSQYLDHLKADNGQKVTGFTNRKEGMKNSKPTVLLRKDLISFNNK